MKPNAKHHKQLGSSTKSNSFRQEFQDFSFTEIDGVKVLDQPSNSTVTSILNHGPALEWELMQAMTYSQRLQKQLGYTVSPSVLRQKFPTVDRFCDDDQVQEIACSEPGKVNPHKHTVHILSERLQIPPATVDRYFRNPTRKNKKAETNTKRAK